MSEMLVIVDSEAKVAALRSQLGGEADLFVLTELPVKVSLKPCTGPQCDRGKLSFAFTPLAAGEPLLAKLRQYVGRDVYLAFECGARGEFLCWLVAKALAMISSGKASLRRLHLLALHGEELRESFRLVVPICEDLAVSYHDRAVFDAALGRHLLRLLGTQTGPAGVPLSTACLTTLFLLAEREKEVKNHAPRPKYRVMVKFAGPAGVFPARLVYAYGVTDDGDLYNAKEADAAVRVFQDEKGVVLKVERTELTIAPPPPYRLVDLLADAQLRHGIPLEKTAVAVRQLFDGIAVDGTVAGLITTYAAVDISITATVEKLKREVARLAGAQAVDSEASVAMGEGFLLPTRPDLEMARLEVALDEEGAIIYDLIRRRALASQMSPARGETVAVEIQVGEHCFFEAAGADIAQQGFLALFHGMHEEDLLKPSPLAHLQEGNALTIDQIIPEQAGSALSRFYTIETLFADLADFAIEAEPGVATLLHLLHSRGYLEIMTGGELRCRENVEKVVSTFSRLFPTMPGINLSAYLEQTVAEVLSGRKTLDV
ncbi:MAG: DNA topoisomerase, partial [Desulfobulbaceae bacterium]|nr:DNA topoisomerase [Desulfobulbaceae bacterium]